MKTCTCKTVATTALSAAGLVGLGAAAAGCHGQHGHASAMGVVSAERPDCPGKIVCPITGELICADQCPAESSAALAASGASCCAGSQ